MKICFFLSDITHTGGIERVTSILCRQFQKEDPNLKIDIVSAFRSGDRIWYPIENVDIHFVSEKKFDDAPHSAARLFKIISNIWRIKNFFRHNHYDLIISQSSPNTFILYLAGIDTKKIIAVEHVYYGYYNNLVQKLRLFIYKKCKKVVVLTKNAKTSFDKHLGADHTVVIPNPATVEATKELPSLTCKSAIAVGRLQHQKGFDTLIDIFAEVHKKHPDWTLNIYGEGGQRQTLSESIKRNHLEDVVCLKGRTDHVAEALRQSSFFILSSRFEGFPMVLLETMSQGVPPVSFNCPDGPEDLIRDHYNGILVPDQDKTALLEGINYMIEHPTERVEMGKHAIESLKDFSCHTIALKWLKLFQS